MIYVSIAAAIAALPALYLFLIMTEPPRGRMKPFEDAPVAHRGLFGDGAPENTLAAFARAAERGYGIELDVQLTADSRLVVFHDATLRRMFGANKKLSDLTFDELREYTFPGTGERVPLFEEVLRTVGGRSPLIIEVKSYGRCSETCRILKETLEGYGGAYCVESFDPRALKWFRKNCPGIVRGQLSQNYFKSKTVLPLWQRLAMTSLLADFIGRPSFIAYNHSHRIPLAARILKRTGAACLACWTVRGEEEFRTASEKYSVIIFDSFIPSLKRNTEKY